uniref:Integrase catalytic domain-containing protein n=1 Tax=Strigamia maritima TaxID=126957 RepID=T1ILP3_STRMM
MIFLFDSILFLALDLYNYVYIFPLSFHTISTHQVITSKSRVVVSDLVGYYHLVISPNIGSSQPHNKAYPWETICVDLCGPKPTAQSLKKWILVIVDQRTKYVELFPLATASSAIIAKKINEVACRWGHPSKIISDNGSQF